MGPKRAMLVETKSLLKILSFKCFLSVIWFFPPRLLFKKCKNPKEPAAAVLSKVLTHIASHNCSMYIVSHNGLQRHVFR